MTHLRSTFSRGRLTSLLALLCLWIALPATHSLAQEEAKAMAQAMKKEMRKRGGQSGGAEKTAGNAEESGQDGEGKPDGEKDGEGEDGKGEGEGEGEGETKPEKVTRPTEPPEPPDPKEFEARADEDGRIRFSFRNQPWADFMEWLADVSGYTFDWLEMPEGYLNLVTQRSYTKEEARDLVNSLLLSRGYTTILRGRLLTLVKLDKLDPSLLPRAEDESELMDLLPHEFVKITFRLPEKLNAAKIAEEIKLLLSPNGKVQPLVATNRLLVVDAVANLRDVSLIVNAEHAETQAHELPREFYIRHVRADYVADQVMILLGLDPSTRRNPQELQVEQQRLQLFMQMQQRGKDVTKFLRGDNAPTVFITVNKRINSLLVVAPPTEMVRVERTIEKLDVPAGAAGGSQVVSAIGNRSDAMITKKYDLISLKPESVVTALKEIGDLDPRTALQMDSDAKVIFATATEYDHSQIADLVLKLDGTKRETRVIWLKRLPADQVAISIRNLLMPPKKEESSNSRSFYSYRYGGGEQKEKKPKTEFRIEPDIENNRLLIFANKNENDLIDNLLQQLGELPGGENPNTIRVQDPRGAKETAELLDRLKQAWPNVSQTPLKIEGSLPKPEEATTEEPAADAPEAEADERMIPKSDEPRTTQVMPALPSRNSYTKTAGFPHAAEDDSDKTASDPPVPTPTELMPTEPTLTEAPATSESPVAAAPQQSAGGLTDGITINVAKDGRLILSSKDTAALDQLEELVTRISPPPRNYEIFRLKYALASLVKLNLEEFFEGESTNDSQENWMRAWYGLDFKKETKNNGLASRRAVRFIYDIDTNSVLVRDATAQQLETIRELIEIYDTPPSEDSISARHFSIFKLEYSQAEAVAATIKEVFRDLLSSKDKEFANGKQEEKKGSSSGGVFRIFGGGGGDDDDSKPTKVKASFEGALSIGVDVLSNAVIVSAQEEWMPTIQQMIENMDKNAKPDTTVVVHSVTAPISPETIRALSDMMRPWPGNKKPDAPGSNKGKKPADNKKPKNGNEAAQQQAAQNGRDDQ